MVFVVVYGSVKTPTTPMVEPPWTRTGEEEYAQGWERVVEEMVVAPSIHFQFHQSSIFNFNSNNFHSSFFGSLNINNLFLNSILQDWKGAKWEWNKSLRILMHFLVQRITCCRKPNLVLFVIFVFSYVIHYFCGKFAFLFLFLRNFWFYFILYDFFVIWLQFR